MVEFSKYYIYLLLQFFDNIWNIMKNIFSILTDIFYRDIVEYFNLLFGADDAFTTLDWISFVFVTIINLGFFIFIIIRIVQVIRRRHRGKSKRKEKNELLDEITGLNNKVEELITEKNQLFAMKVSSLGVNTGHGSSSLGPKGLETEENAEVTTKESRFVKLIDIDTEYDKKRITTFMGPDDMVNLPELVDKFIGFSASQLKLFYSRDIIANFFAGMATSKILILEGISGTGKTSLPYAMGKFFKNDASIISVQPSWRDRAEIIGYMNEFTKRFNETDFLKALYETTYRDDLNFIVLDEMNLARIEYYFAEFLSIMEMPNPDEWNIDIVPSTIANDPVNLVDGKLLVPQNIWFVGTANKDDSTFTITDKVYDRATIVEMNHRAKYIDAAYTMNENITYDYLLQLFNDAQTNKPLSSKELDNITKLDLFIAKHFKITFGNRIMKQLKAYIPVFVSCGFSEVEAIDNFLSHKVIRKFETLNLSFLHDDLNELIVLLDKTFGKNACHSCIDMIKDFIKNS